ncbi:MAG TPA: DUF1924 domain-containing protein [Oceanospirillales bacterium]|nr:DUF1924 domain-containing protein [Oceanospirillales bacterium]
MLATPQQVEVTSTDSERGKTLWNKAFITEKPKGKQCSCANCHGADVRQSGEHIRTGQTIKPMAKSVNNKRFTNAKKRFKRNCKWTLGREFSVFNKPIGAVHEDNCHNSFSFCPVANNKYYNGW